MRAFRVLLAVAVLAIVLVAIDFGARLFAQTTVSRELAQRYGLADRPNTDIDGWPFLVRAAEGDVPHMSVTAETVTRADIAVRRVEFDLDDVTFSPVDLGRGNIEGVRTAGGSGRIVIDDNELARAVTGVGGSKTGVHFEDGRVVVTTAGQDLAAGLSLEEGRLVISAPEITPTAMRLPSFGDGISFNDIRIGKGTATLTLDIGAGRVADLLPG